MRRFIRDPRRPGRAKRRVRTSEGGTLLGFQRHGTLPGKATEVEAATRGAHEAVRAGSLLLASYVDHVAGLSCFGGVPAAHEPLQHLPFRTILRRAVQLASGEGPWREGVEPPANVPPGSLDAFAAGEIGPLLRRAHGAERLGSRLGASTKPAERL
jgi:hypothetical protein